MSSNTITVQFSIVDQIRYFLENQPPFVHLLLAYAVVCLLLYWSTRSKGYIISFVSSFLFLVPFFVRGY